MRSRFSLEPYTPADAAAWDALIAGSPNATFLFQRGFMDYHADRFPDASLLVRDRGKLVAVLPAHRSGARLVSHGGLSYGGLLLADTLGLGDTVDLVQALRTWCGGHGVQELVYKTVPSIYHRLPCEDDRYALWRAGAQLLRRDALSVIGPLPAHWPPRRRRAITQATRRREGLALQAHPGDAAPWAEFWPLLTQQLQARHGSAPAHSESEIALLAGRFPGQIALHAARWEGKLVAGLVLFETPTARHLQYMAADAEGRRVAALDLLLEQAIEQAQAGTRWFSFGHSQEDGGHTLNSGLSFYKESFGASAVVQDHYVLPC